MASDRRAYFRVADSIQHEGWDDATIADIVRLSAHLNTKWAREKRPAEDAGKDWLTPQDCMTVTGRASPRRARARVTALPRRSGVTMTATECLRGGALGVTIDWPKFHIFQGYKDRETPEPRAEFPRNSPESVPASAPASETAIHSTAGGENGASKIHSNSTPTTIRINPVDLRALPVVERFVDALHREEARRKLPATRVSQLVTERLRVLATRIGDYDLEAWERRAVNAVERRVRSSADDCSVAWTGPVDDTVALRLDQLASSPGWTKPEAPYAYKGPNTTWGMNDA